MNSEKLLTFPDSVPTPLSIRAKALVFHDPASLKLLGEVERVARSEATVLIIGETGTGKELVARHIHQESGRKGPFIAVNCGAFSESLIDAELFGHESGAFTGASQARAGWFEAANGGTLFLDEIGDLPMALQVKLLRVLQERQVVRLGSRKPIPLDVRLVAATNIDLAKAVDAQHFRADLYYRLSVATLRLPALRERPADIVPLARHFIQVYSGRLNLGEVHITERAHAALIQYSWPGNIRELENVIHFALIVCRDGVIRSDDIKLVPLSGKGGTGRDGLIPGGLSVSVNESRESVLEDDHVLAVADAPVIPASGLAPDSRDSSEEGEALLKRALQRLLGEQHEALFDLVEAALVQAAFEQADHNQVRAARLLGITRNMLRTQLQRHGLLARRSVEDANDVLPQVHRSAA